MDHATRLIILIMSVTVLAAILIAVMYAKFKKGLPTRIFVYVTPAIMIVAVVCYYSGGDVPVEVRLPLLFIGSVVTIVLLIALYRSAITNLGKQTSGLLASASQIAATSKQTAAKAGESGSGFAVVASEVRRLAEQSKQSAQRIQETIDRSEQGRLAIETARSTVQDLAMVLDESVNRARHISATASQQAMGIRQISDAMSSVAEGGRNSEDVARQLEDAAASLHAVTGRINNFVMGR